MKSLILLILFSIILVAEDCPSVNQIKSSQTPLDMFKKLPECFKANRYDDAAKLYIISQTYGKYDTLRVSDRSAHQAVAVMRMSIGSMLNTQQLNEFQNALDPYLNDRTQICSILTKLGKPNYHPSYMINHGLNAFNGPQQNNGLNADFNPESAWKETLGGYMKCTLN